MTTQYKSGNEFLPYHPSASHTPPDYRDGWNACFEIAASRIAELEKDAASYRWLRDKCGESTVGVYADANDNHKKRWLHGFELDKAICMEKAWEDVPDATAFVEELRGNTDKSDCVWEKLPCGRDASGNDISSYDPSCIVVYTDEPLPMKLTMFCHLCGGAVKEST